MTYPQQPQYAYPQQGYAGPGPVAQPQYVQQAPAQTYAPPQFAEPPRMGEGGAPLKIRELEGRACGIRPTAFTPANPQDADDHDKITFDVLVLDGPTPLEYGASAGFRDNPAGPACYALDSLPAEIKGVVNGNWEIVKACKAILDTAPGNVIPCRIVRGTQGNRPFLLAALGGPSDPQAADADRVRGMLGAAYVAIGTGRWPDGSPYVAPVPREINGGPRQKPTTQATPAQPATAQYPPQPAYPPAPVGQVVYPPAGPTQPTYAPQPVQQAPAPQQFTPDSREAFLSGQDVPGGWNPDVWRGMSNEDRARFLPQG